LVAHLTAMKPAAQAAPSPHRPAAQLAGERPAERTLDTEALFAGATTVAIRHQGERYQLRITRQGKLILTK
jgi:hemin uptake protein HemP